MIDDYDRTTEMTESGGFVRIHVKLKRGDSPRNEETISAELAAPTLDELEDDLERFHRVLYGEAARARDYQPGGGQP